MFGVAEAAAGGGVFVLVDCWVGTVGGWVLVAVTGGGRSVGSGVEVGSPVGASVGAAVGSDGVVAMGVFVEVDVCVGNGVSDGVFVEVGDGRLVGVSLGQGVLVGTVGQGVLVAGKG